MISEMKSNDFAWCPLARTFHAGWRAKANCRSVCGNAAEKLPKSDCRRALLIYLVAHQ